LVDIWMTPNTWNAQVAADIESDTALPQSRRYWISPQDMLEAMRYAHSCTLDVIGVYHSHPDHPAEPSECDRRFAWSQYSYVIVSVQQGSSRDIRSWVLDNQHQFQAEPLVMIAANPLNSFVS